MKLFVYLIVLIAAAISMANPVEPTASLLICTGPEGTGTCADESYKLDTCNDLPSGLVNNVTTFAPKNDGIFCYIFLQPCDDGNCTTTGCTEAQVTFYSHQKNNLTDMAPGWDRLITSFACREGTTPP